MARINNETRKEIAIFLNKNFSFKDFLLSNAFKDFLSNMAKIVTENPKVTTNVVITMLILLPIQTAQIST